MSNEKKIKIADIIIDEAYYPRFKESPAVISSYVLAIDPETFKTKLPPVTVTTDPDTGKFVLLDGYHRVSAFKRVGATKIPAEVRNIPREDWMWVAAQLNANHGHALSGAEKTGLAQKFFLQGRDPTEIAKYLSMSERQINRYIEEVRLEKDLVDIAKAKEAREEGLSYRKAEAKTGIPKSTIEYWEKGDWKTKDERKAKRSGITPEPAKSDSGQASPDGQGGIGSRKDGTLAKMLKKQSEYKTPICTAFKGLDNSKEYEFDSCVGCKSMNGGLIGTSIKLNCKKGHQLKVDWILRQS